MTANTLALQNEYDEAKYLFQWNGYKVYLAYSEGEEKTYFGLPTYILEKDDVRFANSDEQMEILQYENKIQTTKRKTH